MQHGPKDLCVFALKSSRALGEAICNRLDLSLAAHEERGFEDGEHKSRPLESVRDKDVYVISSLHGDGELTVNDKLCRALFFLGALRDAGAGRLTAVLPYLCYARKDRRTKPRDPVTTRYVAALFEAVGIDRMVTIDVHNPVAYENAFRKPAELVEAFPLFVDHFTRRLGQRRATVVSPDAGGAKRAERFRQKLEHALSRPVESALMGKSRSEGVVSGEAFAGDVQGRVAIIIDDLIASGTTLARAAEACRARGAAEVHAAATHGLFVAAASGVLERAALDSVVITNTVPPAHLAPDLLRNKIVVLNVAPLFAECIRRLHTGGSLVELIER